VSAAPPETRYARSGDVRIAYQVVGNGDLDVVWVPGVVNHLDAIWADSATARFFSRLAAFSRLILFDKRGTGLSDRNIGEAPLEDRMDDVRAVMDAVGSNQAALVTYSEGGPMSLLFAATYPDRLNALVLVETTARAAPAADYPCGSEFEAWVREMTACIDEDWGRGTGLRYWAPSFADRPGAADKLGWWERMSASPGDVLAIMRVLAAVDVRALLPAIHVPTLVIHRRDSRVVTACHGKYLASHIPGARYFEQPGDSHIPWLGDAGPLLDEIEEFLTGSPPAGPEDRVLATVLFTDIVESTQRAAQLGDRRWREMLDEHDGIARREVDQFHGRLIKSTGDGVLATFDGPGRAIRCACALRDRLAFLGLEVRSGLHTGEIELRDEEVGGIAVHLAARVAACAGPGEVLVSRTVTDLVAGSGLRFVDKGSRSLKGIEGERQLFAVDA
jgi:class 3 adenylate cyclase/pimeloyl-ACP methyl ester carboxylesterase